MKPFYITLPSGGEGNKTSSFTVNLPYEVDLHGEWEVALVDVIYPTSWYNVYDGNNLVRLCHNAPVNKEETPDCNKEGDFHDYFLTANYYDKVDDILEQLNVFIRDFSKADKAAGKFKNSRGYVMFISGNGTVRVLVHEDVADMLGHDSPLFNRYITSELYPSLIMQNLYVYTDDLIEPQIVGDVRTVVYHTRRRPDSKISHLLTTAFTLLTSSEK